MKAFVSNRCKIGEKIEFSLCDEIQKAYNYVFFKLDDGWGIANEDGEVLVSNNLANLYGSRLGNTDDSLVIVKDIDTGLCGVISRMYAKEIIPCKYTFIEPLNIVSTDNSIGKPIDLPVGESENEGTNATDFDFSFFNQSYSLFFKVKKTRFNTGLAAEDGLWGLYNENGQMVIGTRYYDIKIQDQCIECRSTDDYDISYGRYTGKIDLYTLDGDFIIGGVDFVSYYNNYIALYIGTIFDSYNEIPLFDDAVCIILDKQFNSVLKCNGFYLDNSFWGMSFKNKDDFRERISEGIIIEGCYVDMQAIYDKILFLEFPHEQFLIPEFVSNTEETISTNIYIDGQLQSVELQNGRWKDNFIEDSVCVIVKFSEDGSFLWSHRVNEVFYNYGIHMFYRIGDKVGIFTGDGIHELKYTAVSQEFRSNGTRVVAIKEKNPQTDYTNPNYNHFDHSKISFYEMDEKERLTKLDDDWEVFDPRKISWFPECFKDDNNLSYDNDYYEDIGDYHGGWSWEELEDAADIAYEGYSRLELGLD